MSNKLFKQKPIFIMFLFVLLFITACTNSSQNTEISTAKPNQAELINSNEESKDEAKEELEEAKEETKGDFNKSEKSLLRKSKTEPMGLILMDIISLLKTLNQQRRLAYHTTRLMSLDGNSGILIS